MAGINTLMAGSALSICVDGNVDEKKVKQVDKKNGKKLHELASKLEICKLEAATNIKGPSHVNREWIANYAVSCLPRSS